MTQAHRVRSLPAVSPPGRHFRVSIPSRPSSPAACNSQPAPPPRYHPDMKISYRIGVMPGPWPDRATMPGALWDLVDLCERTEIDSLWLSERLSSPTPMLEPITTMAAIAARTTRLKFGPSVLTI